MNTLPAPQAAVKPAAVILFDSASRRTPQPFGTGIKLYSAPSQRVEYTAADAAWWAAESARMAEARELAELNAEVEAMAEESRQYDAYMAGMC